MDDAEDFNLSPSSCRNDYKILRSLISRTSLDEGQCQAIITALSHELALLRGPPGTGKSYIGLQLVKVLLQNREKAHLGPIIVVYVTSLLTNLIFMDITDEIQVPYQSCPRRVFGRPCE